jgi:hypothetical protein
VVHVEPYLVRQVEFDSGYEHNFHQVLAAIFSSDV